jgi:hypothetical protein
MVEMNFKEAVDVARAAAIGLAVQYGYFHRVVIPNDFFWGGYGRDDLSGIVRIWLK